MPTFDLDHYLSLPRVAGLALSPDGHRLVTSVATVAPEGKRFVTALWELDPDGERQPRRLTRSAPGESGAAFLPDGSLLFISSRPDPDEKPGAGKGGSKEKDKDDEVANLWLLPVAGGEARLLASAPGGIETVVTARDSGTIVLATASFPGVATPEEDEERAKAREEAGVRAQLFEQYPIRYWDHYLGPRERRLLVAAPPPEDSEVRLEELRPITPDAQRHLDQTSFDVTPDGATVVAGWVEDSDPVARRTELVAIDTTTADRRVLASEEGVDFGGARCSPDGRWVVCQRSEHGTRDTVGRSSLWLIDLTGATAPRDLTPGLDLAPHTPVWAPDSSAVLFTADQGGRGPLFRVEVLPDGGESGTAAVTRLSADGYFTDVCPSPDGTRVFALRSSLGGPPGAAVLDARAADQDATPLPSPGLPLDVPGRLEELEATAADGVAVHSWLVLPPGASATEPAPLVVFIHGGPIASWNTWSWRWCPHLLAARGYAVLLPDPALSTGYGQAFMDRGRSRWGEAPFTDLMAAVDAAVARDDIDESKTAAMGGSFGGYMANWVAGHTDRFRGIVTHASLWALDQFHGTTDVGVWWEREFGDPYADLGPYLANSPHRHIDRIRTPMLVVHGELDHRVPVGEALRLWTDLKRHGVDARFLYFPDENHWILKPQNVRVWYEAVFAFLDHRVLGKDFERPALL